MVSITHRKCVYSTEKVKVRIRVKVKVPPYPAMKAQRVSRDLALLFP
jgi:hypothetical protein